MNAKKINNADTKTVGSKTQCSVLNSDELASGQPNQRSRAGNSRRKKLLANTGENQAAKTKTRRTKKKTKVVAHKETKDCYAVIIQRADGSQFYSSGTDNCRALFYRFQDAVKWKKSLKQHLLKPHSLKTFVVKVTVTIERKK